MAKADIQKAMNMLDPEECARVYELPNLMARENFRLGRDRVGDFDSLMELLIDYYIHHFRKVVVDSDAMDRNFAKGFVYDIVNKRFKGGMESAYRAANTGIDGGLPAVLDCVRDHFLEEQEERYFNYTLMEAVDLMDLDDIKTLMEQYLERYGRHLDVGETQSPEFLVPRFQEVLKTHAQVVRHIRRSIGR